MPAHFNPPNRAESEILARIKALTGKVESLAELVMHRRVGSSAASLGRFKQRQSAPVQQGVLGLGRGISPAGSLLYTPYELPREEENAVLGRGLLDGGKRRRTRSKRNKRRQGTRRYRK